VTSPRHPRSGGYPAGMRYALAVLAYMVAVGGAEAAQPTAKQLIKAYTSADVTCRGSQGDAGAPECERRTRLTARLNQIGWCYGKRSQDRAEFRWHHCTFRSLNTTDLEPR
jgi:hypothetical protein